MMMIDNRRAMNEDSKYETVKKYLIHAREQLENGQPQQALEVCYLITYQCQRQQQTFVSHIDLIDLLSTTHMQTLVYAMNMMGLEVEALKATERYNLLSL